MKLHLALICLFVGFHIPLSAQKKKALKYKEIYDLVLNGPEIKAFQALQAYQAQNPDGNANVYYQLGKLCHKWMRKYDPLKETEDVTYFIRHTKIYLDLCKSKLTSADISTYQTYYLGVELTSGSKKVKLEDVQVDINRRLEDVKVFEEKHKQLLVNYYNSLEHYNQCIELFMEINRKNTNLKHVYLTVDQQFSEQLDALASTYDSAITYFTAYQNLVSDYPMGDYNPTLSIDTIKTYRLHGLTTTNFSSNEVHLWDFGKWVKAFKYTLAHEIEQLRNEVEQTGTALGERISFFSSQRDYNDNWTGYRIPNKTAFHMHKWDYQSDLLDLFRYQEAKIHYLQHSKLTLNDPTSFDLTFQQKAQYYQRFLTEKSRIDSIHQTLLHEFTPQGYMRHQGYLSGKYGSKEGINAYIQEERAHNQRIFQNGLANFKAFTLNSLKKSIKPTQNYKWKKQIISTKVYQEPVDSLLFQSQPDSLTDGRYYTYHRSEGQNGVGYIAGFYKPTTRFAKAFVAKTVQTDSTNKIVWVKVLNRKEGYPAIATRTESTSSGCIVAITIKKDTLQHFLVTLDSLGKIVQEDTLPSTQIPRFMDFDQINRELLIICKGKQLKEDITQKEEVTILMTSEALQTKWQHHFSLAGNIVDMIRSNNTYYAFGNFTGIQTASNQWHTPSVQSSIFSVKLPHSGRKYQTQFYSSITPTTLIKVVKNTSNRMSLLGLRQPLAPFNRLLNNPKAFYYSIIDYDGKVYFDNK